MNNDDNIHQLQSASDQRDDAALKSDVLASLRSLEYDVSLRNVYMNMRDRYLWGRGLYETLNFPDGFDQTTYNYLPRVVDIHTAQLMGRNFNTFSWFHKEDTSLYTGEDPQVKAQLDSALLLNKQRKTAADGRKRIIDQIIRDNGGFQIFKNGAREGSAYGNTIYKGWFDPKEKKYKIVLLESPHNYRAGWSDSDFRQRDWDGYVYQISEDSAYKQWGDKLHGDDTFDVTQEGFPLSQPIGNMNTSDPLDQNTAAAYPVQTQRPMVAVIDFTGIRKGWGVVNGKLTKVPKGQEKPFQVLIVGGHIVSEITDEKLLPKYYLIRNREIPRRAWGESDLPDSALEINATYLERMSDLITVANKTLFPMIMAKGFITENIPKKEQRKIKVVPMDQSQNLEVLAMPTSFGAEYEMILNELKDAFVHVTGIGRILFDDPTVDTNSNPAITTMMKGVIDIVEDKQSRWEPMLIQMFTDALNTTAEFIPEVKALTDTGDSWFLYIQWPNVLRKEDPAFQAMLLSDLHTGAISIETYMEQRGIPDVTEELNRLRSAMKDPIQAAIHGNRLSELAQFTIYESLGVPLYGFNQPKITLRGDLTPQQEGNIGDNEGWDDGPYGASIGPQGAAGTAANQNVINQGEINFPGVDPRAKYGMPASITPGQQINPAGQQPAGGPSPQAPGQAPAPQGAPVQGAQGHAPIVVPQGTSIGTQPVSQPGSGATTVSPQGANKQTKQRRGR